MKGFIYKHIDTDELYIVAIVKGRFYLVCLHDGCFWSDCDTQAELEKVISRDCFLLFNGTISVKNGKAL